MVETVIWFGLAAAALFTAAVTAIVVGALRGRLRSPFYNLPPFFALVAGITYSVMAAVEVEVVPTVLPELLQLTAIRYVGWLFATAVITYYLGMLSSADMENRLSAVGAAILLVVAGFVAALNDGLIRWGMFGMSVMFFVGIVFTFLRPYSAAMVEKEDGSRSLFTSLRDLTIGLWTLYLLVFVLGRFGIEVLTVADYHFVNVTLDIAAMVGIIAVLLLRQYELRTFVTGGVEASPS